MSFELNRESAIGEGLEIDKLLLNTTPWYIMSAEHPHTLQDHVKAWQEHELHREAGVRESKQRFEAEMSRIMTKKVENIALSWRENMLFMRQMYLEAVSAKTYSI